MNSKAKGEKTEGIILGYLMRQGCVVLLPFGNNQRYDMVIDFGDGKLIKAQCKTASYKNGCINFWSCSTNGFTGKKSGYKGQVDIFLIYSPKFDEIYKIPVNDVCETQVNLRVEPPKKGGATSKIKWAKKYKI